MDIVGMEWIQKKIHCEHTTNLRPHHVLLKSTIQNETNTILLKISMENGNNGVNVVILGVVLVSMAGRAVHVTYHAQVHREVVYVIQKDDVMQMDNVYVIVVSVVTSVKNATTIRHV